MNVKQKGKEVIVQVVDLIWMQKQHKNNRKQRFQCIFKNPFQKNERLWKDGDLRASFHPHLLQPALGRFRKSATAGVEGCLSEASLPQSKFLGDF